ncbi:MAG: methyltransferase domain-containing protein, partial [Chloroflexota bacterium]
MTSKEWQLATDSAQRYQDILVPSILGPFADALVDSVTFEPQYHVVDIGCGTGAATRAIAGKIDTSGKVIGVDINDAMLTVAQSIPTETATPI